jgi:hypothetical protein
MAFLSGAYSPVQIGDYVAVDLFWVTGPDHQFVSTDAV